MDGIYIGIRRGGWFKEKVVYSIKSFIKFGSFYNKGNEIYRWGFNEPVA